jgi:hypothetical protein
MALGFSSTPDLDTKSRIKGWGDSSYVTDGRKPVEKRLKYSLLRSKGKLLGEIDEGSVLVRTPRGYTNKAVKSWLDEVNGLRGFGHLGDARNDPNLVRYNTVADQVALHDVPKGLMKRVYQPACTCLTALELERVPTEFRRKPALDGESAILSSERPSSDPRRSHLLILCLKKIPPTHDSPHAAASAQTGFLSSSVFMMASTRDTRTGAARTCA